MVELDIKTVGSLHKSKIVFRNDKVRVFSFKDQRLWSITGPMISNGGTGKIVGRADQYLLIEKIDGKNHIAAIDEIELQDLKMDDKDQNHQEGEDE